MKNIITKEITKDSLNLQTDFVISSEDWMGLYHKFV